MALSVVVTNAHRCRLDRRRIAAYVRRVLRTEGLTGARVSVVVVGNRAIQRLNREYLAHDYPTDVIAFPLLSEGLLEGEIYVNADRARMQASQYSVVFGHEVARLVIHGTLHLAGYDDTTRRGAGEMNRLEELHLQYWFHRRKAGS